MPKVRVIIENGEYGRRAVLHSHWSDQLINYLAENNVVELELNQGKGWRGSDISFLSSLPDLEAFEILDLNIRDVSPIHHLHKLRRLGVTTYCSTGIDFSAFPELESCGLEWRAKSASLFKCLTLTDLFVSRYRGRDVVPFTNLINLERLAILTAPIKTLHGLNSLTRLRYLRLGDLRRLISLEGIEGLASLERLEIGTCRHIGSIDQVSSLVNLKKLYLNNDGAIESLKPLSKLNGLEEVTFSETTNISDGDLSPLLQLEKLSSISFQNRRNYSHRRESFDAYWGKANAKS
jgi:Leucine-rich repeat (LRR) protein